MKYIKWILGLLILGVFLYILAGELFLPADAPTSEYRCEEFLAEWYQIKADGSRVPVDIPGRCDAKRGEVVTIETKLPKDLEDNTYIAVRCSRQDMRVFVDDVLREEYSTKDTRLFGKTSAAVYMFFKLNMEDADKTIRLESQTDSSYSGIFYTMYYGDTIGIWYHFFKQYGAELVVAFLTFFLGLITIIGSIVLRRSYHRKIELEYLGWGVLLAAVWLITNSIFRQIMFPNISVISDVTFLMIMLLPFPFMIYMNEIQKARYEKVYNIISVIAICNFIICLMLHITNQKDFADTMVYIAGVCFLAIFWMGFTMILDIRNGHIKEYSLVAIGVLGVCIGASIQILLYFQRSKVFNGVILAVGLIFLLLLSVINTIREILRMENEKQQAISASKAKARFLANMSHEIRTPINAVLGMDAMILRESKELQIRQYALDIQNAGQSLLALINDILDFSKIESGKMEIHIAEYDLSSTIHDIFNMISMKAEAKSLEMKLFVDENLPSGLLGDDVRLRQILTNLLNNAVKYTHEGSVTLTVSGEIQGEKVLLDFLVEDTGIGIKEEDIKKLFVEFERIEEQKNRNIEGTGLGMNITRQLLEMMGSRLNVESIYGKGSKFSFALEQQIAVAEPIGNLEHRIQQKTKEYSYCAEFTAPDACVLVVDDNAINRRVFVNLLKETRLEIDEASSGKECLQRVQKKQYDVIFLDHMMPDLDGIETLRCMKELENHLCKNAPVVALTANAIAGAKETYRAEGFNEFLSKPIIPEKLEKMLIQLLPKDKLVYGKDSVSVKEEVENAKQDILSKEEHGKELTAEDFPEIAGIDWEYSFLHLKDWELVKATVTDFYQLMDTESDILKQLYDQIFDDGEKGASESFVQGALKQYRIKVHSMKSSAAMIGAYSLSGVAKMLESAAIEQKLETLKYVTPVFLEEWHACKGKLAECVEEKQEKKKTGCADLKQFLQMLRTAMEDMDIDSADEVMKYLKQFEYEEPIEELIRDLDAAVINLDSKKVECVIAQITNEM